MNPLHQRPNPLKPDQPFNHYQAAIAAIGIG